QAPFLDPQAGAQLMVSSSKRAQFEIPLWDSLDAQRPIDWRWRLADDRVRASRRARPQDSLIASAADFLRRRKRRPSSAAKHYPVIAAALAVRHGPQPLCRWEVESCLLAGQDEATIAGLIHLPR